MPDFTIENELTAQGYSLVAGVDEAGRGPLAGPVYSAAVILPRECDIQGLNDSKKLSEKKREQLYAEITEKAVAYNIQSADNAEIDRVNILNATLNCMASAVNGLSVSPNFAIIDGNALPGGLSIPAKSVVKGDSKSMSIAAASVLAKVARDRYMLKAAEDYPEYEFARHKGYGTKLHIEKIREFGASEIHRTTFLKKILG